MYETSEEVKALVQEVLADGKVDKAEVDKLFNIKDQILEEDGNTSSQFDETFGYLIGRYVLEDGEFSQEEADFLEGLIGEEVDDAERVLLEELGTGCSALCADIPQSFEDKYGDYM